MIHFSVGERKAPGLFSLGSSVYFSITSANIWETFVITRGHSNNRFAVPFVICDLLAENISFFGLSEQCVGKLIWCLIET